MKVFVVLSCIALAVAKPQGYSYNHPAPNFGGQSHGVSAPSIGLSAPSTGKLHFFFALFSQFICNFAK